MSQVRHGTNGRGWVSPAVLSGGIAHSLARFPPELGAEEECCPTARRRNANLTGNHTDGHEWALSWAPEVSWAVPGWLAPWPLSTA